MKHIGSVLTLLIFVIGFSVKSSNLDLAQCTPVQKVAHVGVLAYRGVKLAQTRWKSLEHYLTSSIPGWRFEFVPVTLTSTARQIENRKIDFLITNPGHYVTLQKRFRTAAIATRERLVENSELGLLKFGTAIFTRADSNVHSLSEIKGQTLAAVSPDAFGGVQLAWHEFTRQNIDLYQDVKSIRFTSFPQDAIITVVKQGDVDVGIVRSGLLELIASEKRNKLEDFRVIEGNAQFDYPYKVSSRLYPEWPFASMPATSKKLSESLLGALLATQKKPVYEKYSLHDLWSVPLSYNEVRILVSAYHQRNTNSLTSYGSGIFQSPWIMVSAILLLSLLTVLIYLAFSYANNSSAIEQTWSKFLRLQISQLSNFHHVLIP